MERVFIIAFSAAIGVAGFVWFSRAIKGQALQDFVFSHQWLLHPNAICYWRAGAAIVGMVLYFALAWESLAIFIFTVAAIMDGIDGIVARQCKLGSTWGEWLDPMCDKLTYLPPLIFFAYRDIISVPMIWLLVLIELLGQFMARWVLGKLNISGAANNFGKIKAIICFALVIFCALLDANPGDINIGDEVLLACLILSAASLVFKFIPNRLYADILSGLNLACGLGSLYMTSQGRYASAVCLIIIGQLFDLFDGRMAEKHGGTCCGPYLDDIADFVSFGFAPAYMIILRGGALAWLFSLIFLVAVAYRLIRFVRVDKYRTDLPFGIFNGLPSPAGALLVLGCVLVSPALLPLWFLWLAAAIAAFLMVSHIQFAHFGRILLKKVPRPIFFSLAAAIIVILSFIFKTKSVGMFAALILVSVSIYMIYGRKWRDAVGDLDA
ncbi:MAG: CDP-alcohol phosphatidyltransferase family protein [Desulfobulbaceae bacterium]|nr:CDP-alcohol phosphatidyltransferase family protein [Desulfobulbaceae bacterium]